MATTSSDIERLLAAPDARVDLGTGAQLTEIATRLSAIEALLAEKKPGGQNQARREEEMNEGNVVVR